MTHSGPCVVCVFSSCSHKIVNCFFLELIKCVKQKESCYTDHLYVFILFTMATLALWPHRCVDIVIIDKVVNAYSGQLRTLNRRQYRDVVNILYMMVPPSSSCILHVIIIKRMLAICYIVMEKRTMCKPNKILSSVKCNI